MKRASYRAAIRWIADNDEPTVEDARDIAGFIGAMLAANIFDVSEEKVGGECG